MTDHPSFSRGEVTLANWRRAPYSGWSFTHVSELVPVALATEATAETDDAPDDPVPVAELPAIAPDGTRHSMADYLQAASADSFLALKAGRPVAAWHRLAGAARRPHIVFSVSKSITGVLAGIAAADGLLDPDRPVTDHVALPPNCAYADAAVRDLLDMTVDVDFDEAYLDADGVFDRYRRAMSWNPEAPGRPGETLEAFLAGLGRGAGRHGERFYYASPNTDMLGIVLERATGRRYHDYLAERLWRPMGATGSAYVTVDRVGTARAAGGVCVTPRDLARLGHLLMTGGRTAEGRRVVPEGWIDDMRRNGSVTAWRDGNFSDMFAEGRYRSFWYQTGDDHDCFCAVGIHGQWLWVDPTREVVLVMLSSRDAPSDDTDTAMAISVLSRLARTL